jgi:thiol-disulfide isomerase/thioredoxin
VRPAVAEAKGVVPADFATHTGVKNPDEPFAFSFPDLNGNIVSNTDVKFRDKVVIVNITGSWCANCHDEAPYLAELYRKYKALGLEIVALDFEDTEELKDPARLPAFIRNYKIAYTYLRAGETSELNAKVPQAVNLNSWPTTFFLGREGPSRLRSRGKWPVPHRTAEGIYLHNRAFTGGKRSRRTVRNRRSGCVRRRTQADILRIALASLIDKLDNRR